ncbi:hypothetical protein Q7C36_013180 [Tachysurus vachellii]|uniref:Uncharacterized protein n=1 Tax=Tachysurus vachellii TaxID=175792 RepID=A0AA88SJ22_TACVA|nr:hypothetical protein Q7C36_013180 [Tachysurus vachellii]
MSSRRNTAQSSGFLASCLSASAYSFNTFLKRDPGALAAGKWPFSGSRRSSNSCFPLLLNRSPTDPEVCQESVNRGPGPGPSGYEGYYVFAVGLQHQHHVIRASGGSTAHSSQATEFSAEDGAEEVEEAEEEVEVLHHVTVLHKALARFPTLQKACDHSEHFEDVFFLAKWWEV